MNLLAQFIGVIAFLFFVFSIQQKDKKNILKFQLIANTCYAIQYFLLNILTAGLMNIVSLVRLGLFYYYDKKKKTCPKGILIALIILLILIGIISYDGIISLVPIIITILYTLSTYQNNLLIIRWVFVVCGFIWFIFNYSVGAYTAIVGNVFEVVSGLIAIQRIEKRLFKKKK